MEGLLDLVKSGVASFSACITGAAHSWNTESAKQPIDLEDVTLRVATTIA